MAGVRSGRVGVSVKGILIIIILIIHLTGSLLAQAFLKKSLATSSMEFRQKILKKNAFVNFTFIIIMYNRWCVSMIRSTFDGMINISYIVSDIQNYARDISAKCFPSAVFFSLLAPIYLYLLSSVFNIITEHFATEHYRSVLPSTSY